MSKKNKYPTIPETNDTYHLDTKKIEKLLDDTFYSNPNKNKIKKIFKALAKK